MRRSRRNRRLTKTGAVWLLGTAAALGVAGSVPRGHVDMAVGAAAGVLLLTLAITKAPGLIRRYKERAKFGKADIAQVDAMDGFEFERYLGHLLRSRGYKVQVTQESGDFGADLVVEDGKGLRAVVQAKRYSGTVGIKAVQEVVGAKAYYKAQHAWCITNSGYTKAAVELAKHNGVFLYSRTDLIRLISKVKS
jgi:restriction system protein